MMEEIEVLLIVGVCLLVIILFWIDLIRINSRGTKDIKKPKNESWDGKSWKRLDVTEKRILIKYLAIHFAVILLFIVGSIGIFLKLGDLKISLFMLIIPLIHLFIILYRIFKKDWDNIYSVSYVPS